MPMMPAKRDTLSIILQKRFPPCNFALFFLPLHLYSHHFDYLYAQYNFSTDNFVVFRLCWPLGLSIDCYYSKQQFLAGFYIRIAYLSRVVLFLKNCLLSRIFLTLNVKMMEVNLHR